MFDFSLLRQRNDFTEISIIAPEGAIIGTFFRDKREERDVDPGPDQADGHLRAGRRKQVESHPDGLFRADAIKTPVDEHRVAGLFATEPLDQPAQGLVQGWAMVRLR